MSSIPHVSPFLANHSFLRFMLDNELLLRVLSCLATGVGIFLRCVFALGPCMGRALSPRPVQPIAQGLGQVTTSGLTLGWVGPGLSFDWAGPGLGSIAGTCSGHGQGIG